jgi:DNA-binding CsgD family transcriptional regulator
VPPGLLEPLTDRETEVLRLIAAGKPNQQIARELVVTVDTVKKHVSHLLGKLGAANRTEAVTRARQLGLIPLTATTAVAVGFGSCDTVSTGAPLARISSFIV